MYAILVDAIHTFIDKETGLNQEMYELLESYPNPKIILTSANDEQVKQFGLDNMPYEVFTLKHNPEKTDPEYYKIMLAKYGLDTKNVVYFEHDPEAFKSAKSVGINTYYYDAEKKDLERLKSFLDENLTN